MLKVFGIANFNIMPKPKDKTIDIIGIKIAKHKLKLLELRI